MAQHLTFKTCKILIDNNFALTNKQKQNKFNVIKSICSWPLQTYLLPFCVLSLLKHKHIVSKNSKNVTLNYKFKYPLRIQKQLIKNLSIDFGNQKTQLSHKLNLFLFQIYQTTSQICFIYSPQYHNTLQIQHSNMP